MSEFRFSCPKCGQHFCATAAWFGQPWQCPTCQNPMIVPSPPKPRAPIMVVSLTEAKPVVPPLGVVPAPAAQ